VTAVGDCLRQHIDRYCGPKPSGLHREERLGISVARFDDLPDRGLITSITIGLAAHLLGQKSGRGIRQELMTCADERYAHLPWHEILLAVGKQILDRDAALMRGEVIGPAGPLFPEATWSHVTALMCTSPTMFDEDFGETICDDNPLVIVELVPITSGEAQWIRKNGWSAFFDRVNAGEVDIFDLARS